MPRLTKPPLERFAPIRSPNGSDNDAADDIAAEEKEGNRDPRDQIKESIDTAYELIQQQLKDSRAAANGWKDGTYRWSDAEKATKRSVNRAMDLAKDAAAAWLAVLGTAITEDPQPPKQAAAMKQSSDVLELVIGGKMARATILWTSTQRTGLTIGQLSGETVLAVRPTIQDPTDGQGVVLHLVIDDAKEGVYSAAIMSGGNVAGVLRLDIRDVS